MPHGFVNRDRSFGLKRDQPVECCVGKALPLFKRLVEHERVSITISADAYVDEGYRFRISCEEPHVDGKNQRCPALDPSLGLKRLHSDDASKLSLRTKKES